MQAMDVRGEQGGVAAGDAGVGVGGDLKVLVPEPAPVAVPPPAPRTGHGASTSWFADGSDLFQATASWAGGCAGTVVTLGRDATPVARSTLLRAVRRSACAGGPLVLVHHGAGGASLLHTLALEHRGMACVAIEAAPTRAALEAVRALARAPAPGGLEVTVDGRGHATVPAWRDACWPQGRTGLAAGERVVVTGGTGGLGSAVALHLGLRRGLHPVVLDASPVDSHRTRTALARLAAAGVEFTHAVADVTDPASVAAALERVTAERPVAAIVHCAGRIGGGRLATIDVAGVDRLRAPKVDGLRTVVAAVDRRALRVVLAFGSVLSRLPHPGVGAYAYANELLRREVRRAREYAPGPRYLAVEWSVWDDAGMAYESGATAQARRAGYAPIRLADGLRAVERLLAWAGPADNVLVGARFPGLRPRPADGPTSTSRGAREAGRTGRRSPERARTPTPRTR